MKILKCIWFSLLNHLGIIHEVEIKLMKRGDEYYVSINGEEAYTSRTKDVDLAYKNYKTSVDFNQPITIEKIVIYK